MDCFYMLTGGDEAGCQSLYDIFRNLLSRNMYLLVLSSDDLYRQFRSRLGWTKLKS